MNSADVNVIESAAKSDGGIVEVCFCCRAKPSCNVINSDWTILADLVSK
jgi:hypothetical protein